jgi:hypothetical protein
MWWSARRVRARSKLPVSKGSFSASATWKWAFARPVSRAIARRLLDHGWCEVDAHELVHARCEGLSEEARAAADIEGALVAVRLDGREEAGDRLGLVHVRGGDEAVHLRRELNDDVFGLHNEMRTPGVEPDPLREDPRLRFQVGHHDTQ